MLFFFFFFFSSRRRHTRFSRDWSSDVCSSDLAVRCAFWVSFLLLNRGDFARTGGWLARGRRILDDGGKDCVEYGYLLIPQSRIHVLERAWAEAHATAAEAAGIGERFGDLDLVTISRLILG